MEPFIDYAIEAIDGPRMLVATASPVPNVSVATPGAVWASGVENLRELRRQIELRTGRSFSQLDHFFGITPAPAAAYQLGNVILAEYPLEPLGHKHTQIAGQVWQSIIQPWLDGQLPGPGPSPSPQPQPKLPGVDFAPLAVLAIGTVIGYGIVRLVETLARRAPA